MRLDSNLVHNALPMVTVLVAVMVYATLRLFQTAYVIVRDGIVGWQGRRVLGELKQEVDSGRRTPFELFIQTGLHNLQLRDPLRARSFFEAASDAHPMSPHGFYGQGLAWRESLYFSGPLQEQALRRALERDPDHVDARLLLIEFYVEVGQLERAREAYDLLPERRRSESLGHLLERPDEKMPDESPTSFVRATAAEKIYLTTLDCLLVALCVTAYFVHEIAAVAIYLAILLLPYHALLFWRLDTDMEGLELKTVRRHLRLRWIDVTDLVEAAEGGVFLQTRERAIFISRHWGDYGQLLRTIKHHLYIRGWIPLVREYSRLHWIRPLIS